MVEYEYARRRYSWSKRLNWVAIIVALGVGLFSVFYGFLTYLDWQWLSEHFGSGGSSRWTQDVVGGYLVRAILFFAVGGLGVVTFALGFLKVRKALDDDNHDAIKRWSLLTGLIGALPGVGLGGLLEIFVWRAHATDSFTIFGLLGRAPESPPEPPSAMVVARQQAEEDEARRKEEYMALFGGGTQRTTPQPSPNYSYSAAPAYDQGAYGQAPADYDQQPAYEQQPQPYQQPQPHLAYEQQPQQPTEQEPGYEQQQQQPQEAYAQPEAEPTQYHEQPGEAPICTCGRPMEWVAEYGRYYCYTDDRYEGET